MMRVRNFWREEQGQDFIEYTLLLAAIAITSAALYLNTGASVKTIWTKADDIVGQAADSN